MARRLTPAEWQVIKQEYLNTGISYRGIQEKYKVSIKAIQSRANAESWAEIKRIQEENIEHTIEHGGVQKSIRESATDTIMRYELLDTNCQLILQKIQEALEEGDKKELTPSVLKLYTSTMKDVKDITNYKSKLDIEEQRARIAKLRKEVEEDTTDQNVTVVIKEADDYCD